MSEVTTLALKAHVQELYGCGNRLMLKVHGHRETRAGKYVHYDLELNLGRYSVKQLMQLIRSMHIRDRERIANEQKRIEHELQAVQL